MSSQDEQKAEKAIREHAIYVAQEVFGLEGAKAEAKRHILIVQSAVLFSSGFKDKEKQPDSRAEIRFEGEATANSPVTHGYMRFVPRKELRTPQLTNDDTRINVWVDQNFLEQTLAQLHHTNRYLWIGFFDDVHVYSDLHSCP